MNYTTTKLTGIINRNEFEHRTKNLLGTLDIDKGDHDMCFMDFN